MRNIKEFLKSDCTVLILFICGYLGIYSVLNYLLSVNYVVGAELMIPKEILSGKNLYGFCWNPFGPLGYEFNALAYKLFSPTLKTAMLVGVFNLVLFSYLTYKTLKMFLPKAMSFVVGAICGLVLAFGHDGASFAIPVRFASIYAINMFMFMMYFLLKSTQKREFLPFSYFFAALCATTMSEYFFLLLFLIVIAELFVKQDLWLRLKNLVAYLIPLITLYSTVLLQGTKLKELATAFYFPKVFSYNADFCQEFLDIRYYIIILVMLVLPMILELFIKSVKPLLKNNLFKNKIELIKKDEKFAKIKKEISEIGSNLKTKIKTNFADFKFIFLKKGKILSEWTKTNREKVLLCILNIAIFGLISLDYLWTLLITLPLIFLIEKTSQKLCFGICFYYIILYRHAYIWIFAVIGLVYAIEVLKNNYKKLWSLFALICIFVYFIISKISLKTLILNAYYFALNKGYYPLEKLFTDLYYAIINMVYYPIINGIYYPLERLVNKTYYFVINHGYYPLMKMINDGYYFVRDNVLQLYWLVADKADTYLVLIEILSFAVVAYFIEQNAKKFLKKSFYVKEEGLCFIFLLFAIIFSVLFISNKNIYNSETYPIVLFVIFIFALSNNKIFKQLYLKESLIVLMSIFLISTIGARISSASSNTPKFVTNVGAGTVWWDEEASNLYKEMVEYIKVKKVWYLPDGVAFNFLTESSPLESFYIINKESYEKYISIDYLLESIEKNPMNYIVFDYTKADNTICKDYGNELCTFIYENYETEKIFGEKDGKNIVILRKK